MGIVSVFTFTSDTETVTRTKLNGLVSPIATEFNGNIDNSNIKPTAAIAATKLNLSSVVQTVGLDGTVNFTGTVDLSAATISAPVTFADLSSPLVDVDGGSIDGVTIGATVAPTVTDLGSVATCDINGGTADGLIIGGSNPVKGTLSTLHLPEGSAPTTAVSEGSVYTKDIGGQPELFYRTESDGTEVQITSAGFLESVSGVEVFTSDGTFNIPSDTSVIYLTMIGAGGGGGAGAGGSGASEQGTGGGGGAGGLIVMHPVKVVGGTSATIQIGVKGIGGTKPLGDGTDGEDSVFDVGGQDITIGGGTGGTGKLATGGGGLGGASPDIPSQHDFDGSDSRTGGSVGFLFEKYHKMGDGGDGNGGGGGTIFGRGGDGGVDNGDSEDAPVANSGAGGGGGDNFQNPSGTGGNGADGSDGIVVIVF